MTDADYTDQLVGLTLDKHRAQRDNAYAAFWRAVMLAPNLEVCEALMRQEPVPRTALDQYWARRVRTVTPDRLIRLSDIRAIPDMTIGPPLEDTWPDITGDWEQHPESAPSPDTYAWVNLTDPEYATPPAPPKINGILYAGRRHVISGPPESTKTLIAYMLLLRHSAKNEGVAILDFEMGPHAAATLLRELGATDDELQHIHYTEPYGPPTTNDIDRITGLGVGYCLIDAAAGAYDASGLDDNARKDAEQFAATLDPAPVASRRRHDRDRPRHQERRHPRQVHDRLRTQNRAGRRPPVARVAQTAAPGQHRHGQDQRAQRPARAPTHAQPCSWSTSQATKTTRSHGNSVSRSPPTETGEFRHTIYMERISKHMSQSPDHLYSKNELEEAVEGKREHIRAALRRTRRGRTM